MHRSSITLLAATLLVGMSCLLSCQRAQDPPKSASAHPIAKADSGRVAIPPAHPQRDYAADQESRRREVEQEIVALGSPDRRDPDRVREILLRRKGEVLMTQRDVRADASLSDAKRDSLLRALESESIEISKRLLAVSSETRPPASTHN